MSVQYKIGRKLNRYFNDDLVGEILSYLPRHDCVLNSSEKYDAFFLTFESTGRQTIQQFFDYLKGLFDEFYNLHLIDPNSPNVGIPYYEMAIFTSEKHFGYLFNESIVKLAQEELKNKFEISNPIWIFISFPSKLLSHFIYPTFNLIEGTLEILRFDQIIDTNTVLGRTMVITTTYPDSK